MLSEIENDIFKFVAVRNPKKITAHRTSLRYIFDERNDDDSQVRVTLEDFISRGRLRYCDDKQ